MTQWPGEPNGPRPPGGYAGQPPNADPDEPTRVVPKQPPAPSWGSQPPPPSPPQRPQQGDAQWPAAAPSWGPPPAPPQQPPQQGWQGAPPQYPNQYGAPSYPGSPAPKKRRKPLIIAGAIVVVIVVVVAISVAVTRLFGGGAAENLSPSETIQAYLDALSRGDADAALAFGKTQPASTEFLSADILKKQIEESPISDVRILSNDESLANMGMATVQVAANFGDKVSDTQLRLTKVEDSWKLETATIKIDPPTSVGTDNDANESLTVFGKPFGDNPIYVFPGFFDLGSSNSYVDVAGEPFLLDKLSSSSAYLQPDFTLNDKGTKAVNKAIADAYGRCESSSLIKPPNCPVDLNAYDAVEGTVSWGRADLSAVKVGNFDPYSLHVSVSGDIPIPVGYQTRTGGTKTGTVTSYMFAQADLTKSPPVIDFN